MAFGFAASCDMAGELAGVVFERIGPAPAGRLVCFARRGAGAAALLGRLHYTDDLRAALGERRPPADPGEDDAALALAMFERFGTAGLARLEGDFSVVVWDGERRRFVARRDPLGAYPLFWRRVGATTAFATGLAPLLALRPAELAEDHLADLLADTCRASHETSIYAGIARVTTHDIVSVDVADGRVRREPCWDWRDHAVAPATDSLDDNAARYRALLEAAVRTRIAGGTAGKTAAHLSGGMDSSTICLLGACLIGADGGVAPLHALSLVYERLPVLAQETHYIEEVLGAADGIVGHRVAGDAILHFDILADAPPHEEPCPHLWALGQERALLARAAALGVDTVLTGEGADDLLHVSANYLADLIAGGHWRTAWREAGVWAKARGTNAWHILRQDGLAHLCVGRRLLGRLNARRPHGAECDAWSVPAWITPDFARRHALAARVAANEARIGRHGASTVASLALRGLERRTDEPERTVLAAPQGLSLGHPFLDPRVIGFALGLHERMRTPSRLRKPVLAQAMRGVLPESILVRHSTPPFNEILYLGYARNLAALKRLIETAPIDDRAMIDKAVLSDCVEQAALGVAMPSRLRRLNETLSLLLWLSRRAEWEARPLARAQALRIPLGDAHAA
jgi:asparagine synthase (glutamine-hydrolysing)